MTRPVLRELAILRRQLWYETPVRLHSRSGSGRSTKGGAAGDVGGHAYTARAKTQAVGIGWTGLPFAREFERYLEHPERWNKTARQGMLSMIEVAEWCRRRHVTHDVSGRPLCYLILARAAYWRRDPPPALDRLIMAALRHAKSSVRRRPEPLDEPLPYTSIVANRSSSSGRRARMTPDAAGSTGKGTRPRADWARGPRRPRQQPTTDPR